MRWKQLFLMFAVCMTLGLCLFNTDAGAASTYRIKINKQKNTVTVYKRKGGDYEPYKAFVCSVGKATPTGRFRIYQKHRWRALVDSTYGQYCSRFVGPILFYSIPCGITSRILPRFPMKNITSWERRHLTAVSG